MHPMHPHHPNHQPPAIPEMMLALLIGGPFDGKRRTVTPDTQIIREAEFPETLALIDVSDPTPPKRPDMVIHDYHLQHWNLSDGVQRRHFGLFLHQSIRADVFDVVQALIMGYREQKDPGQW